MNDIVNRRLKISKVVYFDNEKKWGVLACSPYDGIGGLEPLINRYGNITVSGSFDGAYEGAELIVSGDVYEHPKFGKQISISHAFIMQDTQSKEGIINFLAKSSISGISVKNAKKIYDRYGKQSIEIVLNDPMALYNIKGISDKTIAKVISSINTYKSTEKLIKYCTSVGLSYSVIAKISKELGDKALEIIKTNPYELLEKVSGLSFKEIDDIFIRSNGDITDPKRLESALSYVIQNLATLEGSTGCLYIKVRKKFMSLLNLPETYFNLFDVTLNTLQQVGKIVRVEDDSDVILYYKEYLDMEKYISKKLKFLENEGYSHFDTKLRSAEGETVIREEISKFPFPLNQQQINAIYDGINHNVFVLTGFPGSGKSTITKALYHIYERMGFKVFLLSPTAKACRRLEECIPDSEAYTIHKFLGVTKKVDLEDYEKFGGETLPYDTVLMIDEASMLDIILFKALLTNVNVSTKIILIGDNNQLPSVQVGNVLGDIIASNVISTSILTDITRQKEDSHIIEFCSMINKGEVIEPCEFKDFHYEEFGSAEELKDCLIYNYMREVEEHGLSEVQVITPYRKGELGMNTLNSILQEVYQNNYYGDETLEPYRMGDRVRHTVNNYDKNVFNGEVGIVCDFNYDDDTILVDYGNKRVEYCESDLEELTLSYASTVHASQGSEYKIVFVVLDDSSVNDFLLIRRLLYTSVSRGKEKVYILTKPYLVDKCITNNSYRPRITKLKDFLVSNT